MPDDPKPLPITYGGKLIKDLSDDELWAAIQSVGAMANFRFDKLQDPRINKPGHRLNKIFKAHPPVENPAFTLLCESLNSEYKLRGIT